MSTEVVVKKWGNSFGAIIPKEFINKHNIKEGDTVNVDKFKTLDFNEMPKMPKGMKIPMSAQEAKDLAREGWEI